MKHKYLQLKKNISKISSTCNWGNYQAIADLDYGLCYGLCCMWSQAFFFNELDIFKTRLDYLTKPLTDSDLYNIQHPENDNRLQQSIRPFLDGVLLYHCPDKTHFAHFISEINTIPTNFESVHKYLGEHEKYHLHKVYDRPYIGTKDQYQQHFADLLQSLKIQNIDRCIIHVKNNDHIIAFGLTDDGYHFFNADLLDQLDSCILTFKSISPLLITQGIARHCFKSFPPMAGSLLALSISIYIDKKKTPQTIQDAGNNQNNKNANLSIDTSDTLYPQQTTYQSCINKLGLTGSSIAPVSRQSMSRFLNIALTHDYSEDVKQTLEQFFSSHQQVYGDNTLTPQSLDHLHSSGLYHALISGYTKTVKAYIDAILQQTKLTRDGKLKLLTTNPTYEHLSQALFYALNYGHLDTVLVYIESILPLLPDDRSRMRLLTLNLRISSSQIFVPGLYVALKDGKLIFITHYIQLLSKLNLTNSYQTLLMAKAPRELKYQHSGLYIALLEGHPNTVECYVEQIIQSTIAERLKLEILLARNDKNYSGVFFALRFKHFKTIFSYFKTAKSFSDYEALAEAIVTATPKKHYPDMQQLLLKWKKTYHTEDQDIFILPKHIFAVLTMKISGDDDSDDERLYARPQTKFNVKKDLFHYLYQNIEDISQNCDWGDYYHLLVENNKRSLFKALTFMWGRAVLCHDLQTYHMCLRFLCSDYTKQNTTISSIIKKNQTSTFPPKSSIRAFLGGLLLFHNRGTTPLYQQYIASRNKSQSTSNSNSSKEEAHDLDSSERHADTANYINQKLYPLYQGTYIGDMPYYCTLFDTLFKKIVSLNTSCFIAVRSQRQIVGLHINQSSGYYQLYHLERSLDCKQQQYRNILDLRSNVLNQLYNLHFGLERMKDQSSTYLPLSIKVFSHVKSDSFSIDIEPMRILSQQKLACQLALSSMSGDKGSVQKIIYNKYIQLPPAHFLNCIALSYMNAHSDIAQLILQSNKLYHINTMREHGTALYLASKYGDLVAIKIIKDIAGINPNLGTHEKDSPLHIACEKGYTHVVTILLTFSNINPNVMNSEGETPLHIACLYDHPHIVQLLLRHSKTKVDPQDAFGTTPLERAYNFNHVKVISIFKELNPLRQQQY